MLIQDGQLHLEPYWTLDFPSSGKTHFPEREYLEEFEEILIDATRIRLRADVPVGAYLSGGLNSSMTAAIVRKYTGNQLDTFSISFSDPEFDESQYQQRMARFLGTQHQVVFTRHEDIGRIFPEVIWHTELLSSVQLLLRCSCYLSWFVKTTIKWY